MDIAHKSWKVNTPSIKKLLSRTITHLLSRQINKEKFEVVNEGFLDHVNPLGEQPDVVVYSKAGEIIPMVAIEICKDDEMIEMSLLAKKILKIYSLKEFFIFDYESEKWLMIDQNGIEKPTSFSFLFGIDLKRMINLFPYEELISKHLSKQIN